ncbi:hypothetical protein ASG35_11765 [Burkholderia sp. Leaf177]|uniref:hypothetical protein n=1 Tax=Burkholderia sp. Leaf177 TaxID=1736287 RepID=UPI0006FBFF48|nr:hypothetical protein [Burkholderia sp. Leaf177]KQR76955.1 hypothetical protein ASG35_11765 [Burkholderia sp. Leaf177]
MRTTILMLSVLVLTGICTQADAVDCFGPLKTDLGVKGLSRALDDGGYIALSTMNINLDGASKAYQRQNKDGGALIHLCNAGRVYLPSGESYNPAMKTHCTGRFMDDLARIEAAGWNDPSVGAIHWFGIVGEGKTVVAGKVVSDVKPLTNSSGFYVSPTSLFDLSIANRGDQKRYVDSIVVRSAVVPKSILLYAPLGSFGVAIDNTKRIAVPFIVGDVGPSVGEGSIALARAVAGLSQKLDITYSERLSGSQSKPRVLWVFFGPKYGIGKYDGTQPLQSNEAAQAAYDRWGGEQRLEACLVRVPH